ncbi:hypothetical protein [Bradyrhizobium neotropicale]|uniref:hypothetical protein n=1 Tax=Bradyrhizobium neotropicale TaxID=1497615 RepID=UPI001AD7D7CF|nr:hypothetical protein [Bradyrhizobium neotropicale]MBO4228162.1 hypothetical protein [Bradyrhizobium neotropicale]
MSEEDPINDFEKDAITRRLTVVRTLMAGDNKAEFARMLGIMPSRWANMERGWPLTMKVAWMLVKLVDGLSVSYLTHGTFGDVKPELREKLEALEDELFPSDSAINRRRNKEEKIKKLRSQLAELESELRPPVLRTGRVTKAGKGRPSLT